MFRLESGWFIVRKWYESRCVTTILRSFRKRDARYHGRNLPSRKSIRRVIDRFNTTGTVNDRRFNGLTGKYCPISPSKIQRVRELYSRTQRISLRRAERQTKVTKYFVRKILRRIVGKKPFKACRTEKLTPSQKLRQVTLYR